MSVLFIDGFDHYAATSEAHYARKWNGYQTTMADPATTPARRDGARSLQLKTNASIPGYLYKDFTAQSTFVVGMAVYFDTLGDHRGFRLKDGATHQCSVYVDAAGKIEVWRGYSVIGTKLATSASAVISVDTWHYLEFKFVIDNSGSYEVKVDGASVMSDSGVDTDYGNSGQADELRIIGRAAGSGDDVYVDDLYVDSADFHGDSRVDTLWPSGAGNYAQWTPSAGSNYQNIDDANEMDDDTTYNSTGVSDEIDSFAYDNLAALVAGHTIDAVALNVCARGDGASQKVTPLCRISTTDYLGTEVAYADGVYSLGQMIWATNPAGGAWTESGINGAEFGYKHTTDANTARVTQAIVEVLRDNANPASASDNVIVAVMA